MAGDPFSQYTTVPMEDFPLSWRLTDPRYDQLPPAHLAQIRPLDPEHAKQLWDSIWQAAIHRDVPFTKGYFRSVSGTVTSGSGLAEERRIKKWLYQRGIPFQRKVFLSYQPQWAIITTWKMFIKYWTAFYYPGDDLTVIDGTLQWALLFGRNEEVFFGTNLARGRHR